METMRTFDKKAVIALTGLTYRQIDYWTTTGIVVPFKASAGKGSRREYSFKDLVQLRVAKRLRAEGISLQKLRKSLAWLRKNFPQVEAPLFTLRFVTDGETLFVMDPDKDKNRIIDTLKAGQTIFSVALGEIIEALRGEVKQLKTPKEIKVWVKNRHITVKLTSNLEDTGYTVRCKEEPTAIEHGETEQEAIDNIIETLELLEQKRGETQQMNI